MSRVREFFTPRNFEGEKVTPLDIFNAPYFRLATLTTIAGTLAYFIGANLPNVSGVTAAITAIVSVRHTFHDSIQDSFQQILGVLIGGTVAFASMQLIGFNSVVVMLAIFTCFVTARLLKLGEEGAIAIAVTVILVVGPNVTASTIEQRFFGVLLGASFATFVSYFVRKGSPQDRALKEGIEQSFAMSALLNSIAKTLTENDGTVDPKVASRWLAKAEFISNEIDEIKANAQSALAGSAWSPAIDHAEAKAVVAQIEMTEATAGTVLNICRELVLTSGSSQQLPALLAAALAGVLSATAEVISDQAEIAEDSPADVQHEDLQDWQIQRTKAIAELRNLDDTQPLLIGGSILRDAEKITEILGD
jgi:uncharacterized membrane protein YgaE (UPF0421/DUF939 family)